MSRAYTVQQGDTYEAISRRQYGDESYARNIERSNPGATNPPQIGATIVIPDVPELALNETRARLSPTQDPDEVTLAINGQVYTDWTSLSITEHLDAVSTVSFDSPFNPDSRQHRDAFRPYSYRPVRVDAGGDLVFTGTLVNPQPTVTPKERTMRAMCYSVPGNLTDCTPPASAYPLQWDEATLRTIAADLCEPFGIQVVFPDGAGAVFERISMSPGERIMPVLARLASQRNFVIRSDATARLVFLRPDLDGPAVAEFVEGQQPILSITPTFGNQKFYSHVTAIAPTIVGLTGPQATVTNPQLQGVLRPFVYSASDMEEGDIQDAVRSKAARMFSDAATYEVAVPTWRNPSGGRWTVGDFVGVVAPGAQIYNRYLLQIRSVRFNATPTDKTATLELMIPGTLSGQLPEVLPWDDSQL